MLGGRTYGFVQVHRSGCIEYASRHVIAQIAANSESPYLEASRQISIIWQR